MRETCDIIVFSHVKIFEYIYKYIHTHTHTHTHIYIYTYIRKKPLICVKVEYICEEAKSIIVKVFNLSCFALFVKM